MGVPPVLTQVMDDHTLLVKHIETHGGLGIPHDLRNTNVKLEYLKVELELSLGTTKNCIGPFFFSCFPHAHHG